MPTERRETERFRGDLTARWEGVLARQNGTLVDISLSGCFILTQDDVRPHELVRLEIDAPANRVIYLWGEVVYKMSEMGFAVRFTGADVAEKETLRRLVDYLRGTRRAVRLGSTTAVIDQNES